MDEELEEVIDNLDEEEVELPEDEGLEVEEDTLDEETEETTEEETEEVDEEETEKERLKAALNAERKQRKALEKALKKSKTSKSNSTYDELIKQGIDKEIAKTLAKAINQPNERMADLQFQTDLTKASKKSEFADIEKYEDEVREFVDKGLTIEQAYYAATGGKKSANTKSDIKREVEAKFKNKQVKSTILDIDTNSTVTETKQTKLKYSKAELLTAKEVGMTIEEYKAMQNIDNIRDYDKYQNSKTKK